jgi:hypothetical protein
MITFYRIREWARHFENNRTRDIKVLSWVAMPVKMDGDGYTELMDHANGAAHFGAWCAIVEIAAKCTPRGTLIRDVSQEGAVRPHDAASLARVSRIKVQIFEEVLARLVSIGWLELLTVEPSYFTEIPQEGAAQPQEGASIPQVPALHNITQQDITQQNTTQQNNNVVGDLDCASVVDVVFTDPELRRNALQSYGVKGGMLMKLAGCPSISLSDIRDAGEAAKRKGKGAPYVVGILKNKLSSGGDIMSVPKDNGTMPKHLQLAHLERIFAKSGGA